MASNNKGKIIKLTSKQEQDLFDTYNDDIKNTAESMVIIIGALELLLAHKPATFESALEQIRIARDGVNTLADLISPSDE